MARLGKIRYYDVNKHAQNGDFISLIKRATNAATANKAKDDYEKANTRHLKNTGINLQIDIIRDQPK